MAPRKATPRLLIAYATSYGHTAKVASAIADTARAVGADVTVVDVAEQSADIRIDGFNGVIVAAAVHASGYGSAVTNWVMRRARSLNAMPTAFASVCLGVLQNDPKVVNDLQQIRDRFFSQTGWTPGVVQSVAGALAYRQYNFVTRMMMKRIAAQAGGDTDTSRDYEYTDWAALAAFARRFAQSLQAGAVASAKQTVARPK